MSVQTKTLLLPKYALAMQHEGSWKPTNHLKPPEPPTQDDSKAAEMEMAAMKQGMDGKPFKKVRPRRTVDYMGGVGRYAMV